MNNYHIKEIEGKQIVQAICWPDDEGSFELQLEFFDGRRFCLSINPPKPNVSIQLFRSDKDSNGKNITKKVRK